MSRCAYCLGPIIGRRPNARYCDTKHARRAAAQKALATARRNRALARVMQSVYARARYRRQWRQIALGFDHEANVSAIFGTLPSPRTHVPEWDGDPR